MCLYLFVNTDSTYLIKNYLLHVGIITNFVKSCIFSHDPRDIAKITQMTVP